MGNKLAKRRQVVDEKYTRPQGLYQHKDVDHKKLRKLILESKLAPCYPGEEENTSDHEECPICFLYYPSLNRSRCCMKSICTECFLQMKTPNSTRPTQCPFCKTSNYAVEYRGTKTMEEKGIEKMEEQRVIEAKIRMRKQELQDDEERMHQRRKELGSSSRRMPPREVDYLSTAGVVDFSSVAVAPSSEETVSSNDTCTVVTPRQPLQSRQMRDDEFDVDLEDIMVMEAIWLSIQENGRPVIPAYHDDTASSQHIREYSDIPPAMGPLPESSSPSGGLACAIAALAERQQGGGESSLNSSSNVSAFNMASGSGRISNRVEQDAGSYSVAEVLPENDDSMTGRRDDGDWSIDQGSDVAEAGTSYAGSIVEDGGGSEVTVGYQSNPGPILPESFEEQMMLAMAVSLAEARAMPSKKGVSWN